MEISHFIIDARFEPDWFEKAKNALHHNLPMRFIGNEEQIYALLKYKHSVSGSWLIQGTLTLEPLS